MTPKKQHKRRSARPKAGAGRAVNHSSPELPAVIDARTPAEAALVAAHEAATKDGKLKAEHGTVNDLDVAIPIAFMGGDVAPATRGDTIRSVDIAPTIAALLHIRPAQRLDGRAVSLRLRAVASAGLPE